jgi:hypothetical protein
MSNPIPAFDHHFVIPSYLARGQRDFWKMHLTETQRLKKIFGNHPLMSVSLEQREKELERKMAAFAVLSYGKGS